MVDGASEVVTLLTDEVVTILVIGEAREAVTMLFDVVLTRLVVERD